MRTKITRRNFLRITGAGAAAAVLTGCGPAARYVQRKPYYEMPEFSRLGESTYYATTCRECPAGCGIIMRTMEGRAIKAEGSPAHPVSQGKICSRGLTAVQGLYNPDRVTGPLKRASRGSEDAQTITWDEAAGVVAGALKDGGSTAFLLGLAPDHLFDLAGEIARDAGGPAPLRYSVTGVLEGRGALLAAMQQRFGQASFPYFDIANADMIFAFGADFLGQWLSPVAYGKAYGAFRRISPLKKRGYLVAFAPRMDVTAGAADEWIPVVPGTEGLVARALAALVGETLREAAGGEAPGRVDIAGVVKTSGVSEARLRELAELFAGAQAPLAIPGGTALSHANAVANADAVLALNAARFNQPGGMFIVPGTPTGASLEQVQGLVQRMKSGQIKTLFIHGTNPLFELPAALGFAGALKNVPLVISFASFPDETALQADYVLPDHTALESFGYQTMLAGANQVVVSALQPVAVPLYNTRSTADVLLAAAKQAGIALAYSDEVAFLQSKLVPLLDHPGGSFSAANIEAFWAQFLQKGGWWGPAGEQGASTARTSEQDADPAAVGRPPDENTFHLLTYATQFGDGTGANKPWLQETPDSMTTVTWGTWVEINPATAERL
ncbi:MAG: nitrate reductase, partial [Chloroflexi bacterium]